MKRLCVLLLLVCAAGAGGCSIVAGNLPSMQHCQEVTYVRSGNLIDLRAKCSAPIGTSGLP